MNKNKNLLESHLFKKRSVVGVMLLILWLGIPLIFSVVYVAIYGADYYDVIMFNSNVGRKQIQYTYDAVTRVGLLLNICWLVFAIPHSPFKWFLTEKSK